MKFFKKVGSAINPRAFAYTSFVLSVCAAVFLSSATWTYGWIADLYPLVDKFVPTLLDVICACAAVNLIYLLICAFAGDKKDSLKGIKAINVIHTIFALLGIVTFIYTFVLVFGLDSGISADAFQKGSMLYPTSFYILHSPRASVSLPSFAAAAEKLSLRLRPACLSAPL